MSFPITIEVTVIVRDDKEAEAIIEAAASGLAELAIKDRVLYGGVAPSRGAVAQPAFTSSAKADEASLKLKPVEVKTTKGQIAVPVEEKPERPRGIMGRRQMNRTGGK